MKAPSRTAFALLLLAPAPIAAVPEGVTPAQAFAFEAARGDANAVGALASGQPEVSLEASEQGGVVAAIVGFDFNETRSTLTFKVSSPLDKDAENTYLTNLSNLPGGTEALIRFTHAWSPASSLSSASLTSVCGDINRTLGETVPVLDPGLRDAIGQLESLSSPLQQWNHLRDKVWNGGLYLAVSQKSARESAPPPTWEEIEETAVGELCSEWNKDRAGNLLMNEIQQTDKPGSDTLVPLPLLEQRGRKDCSIENAIELRGEQARVKAVKERAKAEKQLSEALAEAQAQFEEAKAQVEALRSSGGSTAALEVLTTTASLEKQRAERAARSAYDEAAAPANTARGEEGSPESKEKEAVYKALVASAMKRAAPFWAVNSPFLRNPPGTVADFVCDSSDAYALYETLSPSPQKNRIYRGLLSAAPTQWYFTGEYRASKQDFKFLQMPIALNTETQLIATKTSSEYNHSPRGAVSLFWRGSLFSLGWARRNVWTAAPSAQFCFPHGAGGALTCSTGPIRAPKKSEEDVVDLQWKRQLSPGFALQLQAFLAPDTDTLDTHFITFFLPREKKLRGGLDLSYLEESPDGDDGFEARLFVGVPFSLGLN